MQINSINSQPNFSAIVTCDMAKMRKFCTPVENGIKLNSFLEEARNRLREDKSIMSVNIGPQKDNFAPENLCIRVRGNDGKLEQWGFNLNMESGSPGDWVNGLVQTVNHIKGLFSQK